MLVPSIQTFMDANFKILLSGTVTLLVHENVVCIKNPVSSFQKKMEVVFTRRFCYLHKGQYLIGFNGFSGIKRVKLS